MNLLDIINRKLPPQPWDEGEKIPWNNPAFSERMLDVHLSQDNDWASRRQHLIEGHINWIHNHILKGKKSSILDLACGPGFYAKRLTDLGHTCLGIDFSPASIAYAKSQDASINYQLSDIRTADFGKNHDLVMFVFGEFNVFRRSDMVDVLKRACASLKPGGQLLIEGHTFDAVKKVGQSSARWYSTPKGLFDEKPHLCLEENFWNGDNNIATTRYFIIDAEMSETERYASSMHAYSNDDYKELFEECGFENVNSYPSLTGQQEDNVVELIVFSASKKEEA